jgi:hypothetical protein
VGGELDGEEAGSEVPSAVSSLPHGIGPRLPKVPDDFGRHLGHVTASWRGRFRSRGCRSAVVRTEAGSAVTTMPRIASRVGRLVVVLNGGEEWACTAFHCIYLAYLVRRCSNSAR